MTLAGLLLKLDGHTFVDFHTSTPGLYRRGLEYSAPKGSFGKRHVQN